MPMTGNQLFSVKEEDLLKLLSITSSMFRVIVHDLGQPINIIEWSLSQWDKQLNGTETEKEIADQRAARLQKKALKSTARLARLRELMRLFDSRVTDAVDQKNLKAFFTTQPSEIIEELNRHNLRPIKIHDDAQPDVAILYPPHILAAIIAELSENARQVAEQNPEIIVNWRVKGNKFQMEVHDHGPGFGEVPEGKFLGLLEIFDRNRDKEIGQGLQIIRDIIYESDGQLFFSNSKETGGGLVYLEIPLINSITQKSAQDA